MQKRHITSAISQGFGKFASKEFPHWFQKIVNSSFCSLTMITNIHPVLN